MTMPRKPPMLEVVDLEVTRGGARVLTVPRLAIRQGEILAIIGPNGAGKSTLLLALALLLKPTRGKVHIAGEEATPGNTLRLRRRMAVVFQEPLLLDTSVAQNVATGLKLRGLGRAECEARVAAWLERFGIASLAHRRARSLSGGEAQRTSLARAFAMEPEVLFLDEPFSALDAPTRAAVTADLLAVLRATRTTAVLVTHDRDEALALGDKVGVIIGGELRQLGTPAEVFGAPVDTDVAGFVGVETIAPGEILARENGLAQVRVGHRLAEVASDLDPGTRVFLCLRPEDVALHVLSRAGQEVARSSARNLLPGRVLSVTPWRGQLRVAVDCGFQLAASLTHRSVAEMGIAEGVSVVASFKATSAHLIPRVESPNGREGQNGE